MTDLLSLCKSSAQADNAKALAASKSHSEAERRRRERINKHLSTLRTLLPNTAKTDKASLLAEVIERIKELKQQVAEISQFGPVPSDADELDVDVMESPVDEGGKVLIKASICCADRPSLLTDLVRTLKSLHLRTVKAEMATMEGRTKNVFVMTIKDDAELLEPTLACVEEALKSVMEEPSSKENQDDA
ncbi:hypothetical protein SELMODRAFT_412681 [Selaginella moellendorffii]|uniref:BHLH domain-containing protein n=1 Tax=Selaginella moellendorffii TaxID=88036 RepID=D8RL49_SELML|nr:transcription factor bHLH30 [Selaginella moellendorffii]XP_002977306.1 transcription factor bHLH30 [Selaginella moellendorffii]EFJ21310.1 hypothetical protein SELMODRAFT_417246 [Selaginella moellendorffii]EFJ26854.1 hypothetical protein SELMODRAFT_412681 [Selaginella moellendorffii]|eukprot:XP_002971937.1 transcription factor bHLH30 [Selaginella moellendorffii]